MIEVITEGYVQLKDGKCYSIDELSRIVALHSDAVALKHPIQGVKLVKERPVGDRILGEFMKDTEKAARFAYHGHFVWIPKKSVSYIPSQLIYTAPEWAINSSKSYQREEA